MAPGCARRILAAEGKKGTGSESSRCLSPFSPEQARPPESVRAGAPTDSGSGGGKGGLAPEQAKRSAVPVPVSTGAAATTRIRSRGVPTDSGTGGENGDWLRVFEVPVPFSTGAAATRPLRPPPESVGAPRSRTLDPRRPVFDRQGPRSDLMMNWTFTFFPLMEDLAASWRLPRPKSS